MSRTSGKIGLSPERVRELLGVRDQKPEQPAKKGRGGPRGALFVSRIPSSTILEIAKARDRGEKLSDIARRHGVSVAYASMISYGIRRRGDLKHSSSEFNQ